MKLLIIEDDPNKLYELESFLTIEKYGSVASARSYSSGLHSVIEDVPDGIILDMTMPTFDLTPGRREGRPRAFAGRDLLIEMKRREIVIPVIVVTQFQGFGDLKHMVTLDELNTQLKKEFGDQFLGSVFYHPAESNWKSELQAKLWSLVQQ